MDDWLKKLNEAGGPAFPSTSPFPGGGEMSVRGMSLRDYFAGQALIGLLMEGGIPKSGLKEPKDLRTAAAGTAYLLADAMLAAREEPRHD